MKTTRTLYENGYFYTCTCRIYCTLLESFNNNDSEQYDILDNNGIKCMHCRFLNEELFPNNDLHEVAVTNIEAFVQKGLYKAKIL